MAEITFPASPSDQDEYTFNGVTYQYEAATNKWKVISGGAVEGMAPATYDPQSIEDDAFARANHTGTQAISTVDSLQSSLDGKAASSHNHTLTEITDSGAMAGYGEASVAQVRGLETSALGITTRRARNAAALTTPSGGSNWTPDWAGFISAEWTVAGNRTINNPTNVIPGTTRVVKIVGNNATERTISWGSNYKNPPDAPVTSTSALFVSMTAISSSEIVVSSLEYEP